MTHPRNASPAGAGAEKAAFLRDLRALRDQAGLGPRDLAARAHFPEATLAMAEAGPDLPSLPVLQAYVRGCGAGEGDWEDRWRRLNASDGTDGSQALPTRAPSSSRPSARVMPFPVSGSGPVDSDQDAIGYGLARVARGLVPLSPDSANGAPDLPTRTPFASGTNGNGGTKPSAGFSDFSASGNGGWFDPGPRDSAPSTPSYSPPPAAPPMPPAPPASPPPASPATPTVQYPAAGYQAPEYQTPEYQTPEYQTPEYQTPEYPAAERTYQPPSSSHPAPSYRLPEEFRTPVPQPPDLPGPTAGTPGPSAGPGGHGASGYDASRYEASGPGAGTSAPAAGNRVPANSGAPSSPSATAATPKPHAAPAAPRRRTSGSVIAAVILVLIIAAVIWLVLSH